MHKKKAIAVAVPAALLVAASVSQPVAWAAPGERSAAAMPGDPRGGQRGGNDPGGQMPGDQAPGDQAPGDQAPGGQAPGGQAPGDQAPGDQAPGGQAPGTGAPGDGQNQGGQDQGQGGQDQGQGGQGGQGQGGQDQGQGQGVVPGPNRGDFAPIAQAPRRNQPRVGRNGSRGTFVSRCGTNQNRHHNPDNFITAPGVRNGAHHTHDYVGNLSTDGQSTDESLAAAGTTCARGDKSAYFWPVMRNRTQRDDSPTAAESAADGNIGRIVLPVEARMEFRGNPRSKVVAMPRFMRVITGDAKAGTNGTANARALWTCSGQENRGFTDKYPLCPRGSRLTRILEFPSCWDGQNTDSANHRSHVVFPDQSGACPAGTRAIPQLRMTLRYNLPNRPLAFALDSFPEQAHKPVTDHGDFVNVMPDSLMRTVVNCINSGRRCS
ncbi:hypothetical protein Arub01_12710 [Actinomadura rubrobrunea]|uniref:DUF1996 domain-containing protein n=1 Tax=Actinomadura rubrobrunea TaxID=115335 RepID=A0A9W6PUG1_9ACTN|nr:DUF1996 domain-containing protein [Actinomadura rubrobrunea]GLW63027.1 hypothetical protein Arub01_12710 [Actinomadura rubrobrunea]